MNESPSNMNISNRVLSLLAICLLAGCAKTYKGSDGVEYPLNDIVDMLPGFQQSEPLQLFGVTMNDHISDIAEMYDSYRCVGSREIRVNCFYMLDASGSEVFPLSGATELMVSYLRSEVDMVGLKLEPHQYLRMREELRQYYGEASSDSIEKTTWIKQNGIVELFNEEHANGKYALKISRR